MNKSSLPKAPKVVAVAPGKPNKSAALQFAVVEVSFANGFDIWYARIPVSGGNVGWLQTAPPPALGQPKDHITPEEVRPISRSTTLQEVRHELPRGELAHGVRSRAGEWLKGPRTLTVKFQCLSSATANGSFKVAGSGPGSLATDSQVVQFANGVATATFTLKSVPAKVTRLNRAAITWTLRPTGGILKRAASCASEHTFYFVDADSLAPLGGKWEKPYFELYDWACRWADGKKGKAAVIAAIWKKFSPIQIPHDSGFIYWRNHESGVDPAQDVANAIRSVDPAAADAQFAASCIVFDRMFMNTLAIHGIESSEVELGTHAGFTVGKTEFLKPTGWKIGNPAAQGNPSGPPEWESHWIADVNTGGKWELYDPSYGAKQSPWSSPPAVGGKITPPAAYEQGAGVEFGCKPKTPGLSVILKSANPKDPRLEGTIEYEN